MEIEITEAFEQYLSVTYNGLGHRIEACEVQQLDGMERKISIFLQKVEVMGGQDQREGLSEGMMRKLQAERSLSGQDEQAAVDHSARSDSGPSSPPNPYGSRKPDPASLHGNW